MCAEVKAMMNTLISTLEDIFLDIDKSNIKGSFARVALIRLLPDILAALRCAVELEKENNRLRDNPEAFD